MQPGLTLEEHQDLGAALGRIRVELQKRITQLADAYPQAGPEAVPEELIKEALKTLESVRYELAKTMAAEHPGNSTPDAYYPEEQQRANRRQDPRPT